MADSNMAILFMFVIMFHIAIWGSYVLANYYSELVATHESYYLLVIGMNYCCVFQEFQEQAVSISRVSRATS